MNRRWYTLILIFVLGAALFYVKRCTKNDFSKPATTKERQDPASGINRNHGFDRRISFIEYTEHAKCRMECRHISQAEVEQIMQEGKINYNKSNVQASPCPAYALEGVTKDDQRVRIVFGQCDHKTKVVTVIDLDTDWSCHCPGDDKDETGSPQKNRN